MRAYGFRPMSAGDLPLMRRWLAQPHVAQWWRDADDFEFVSGDLDHPDMAQFIVTLDERPFAYLQCYRLGDWHAGFGPQPLGTRGLDQIIGEPLPDLGPEVLDLYHPCRLTYQALALLEEHR